MIQLDEQLIKSVFRYALSSSIDQIDIAMSISDMLKKRTILGFFSELNKNDIYNYIYSISSEQDRKLDFIYTLYNSLLNNGIDQNTINQHYLSYQKFILNNNLNDIIKTQYLSKDIKHNNDVNDINDYIMYSLYFIRLYIEHFDNEIIVSHNKNNKLKGNLNG